MRELCKDVNLLDDELEQATEAVCDECEVCAKNGQPKSSRKISLTHVNEEFNQEVQMDFFYCILRNVKYTVMNLTCARTGYSELSIAKDRTMDTITRTIEPSWICQHGAPLSFSVDDEYNRSPLRNQLDAHSIQFKPRPARRHNKIGIVERKNRTIKGILAKLDAEASNASPETILARAALFSNMFSGNRNLSSLELARGYRPSILGIPPTVVNADLRQAHREQIATRMLQRLMQSRAPAVVRKELFNPGDPVWVFYKTTKKNEKFEWVRATVVKAEEHFLVARRSTRGPPMRVAYEDVRFSPRSKLTAELLQRSLEEELGYSTQPEATSTATHPPQVSTSTADPIVDATLAADDPPPQFPTPTQPTPDPVTNNATASLPTSRSTRPLPPSRSNTLADNSVTRQNALLANDSVRPNGGEKDVGAYATVDPKPLEHPPSIERDNTRAIDEIHDVIGSKQVTATSLALAQPWILQDSLQQEHDSNWKNAYVEVQDKDIPSDENVISSHVVYRVKTDEEQSRILKARIVPHGNHDDEKDDIRKDSSNAPLFVVRLLLSLVTFLGFRIGTSDIKGAFLQSGPITRDIYVRPPRDWGSLRGIFWKLLKLPYGIADAGRQWKIVVEEWMLTQAGLERVFGLSQLFAKRKTRRQYLPTRCKSHRRFSTRWICSRDAEVFGSSRRAVHS